MTHFKFIYRRFGRLCLFHLHNRVSISSYCLLRWFVIFIISLRLAVKYGGLYIVVIIATGFGMRDSGIQSRRREMFPCKSSHLHKVYLSLPEVIWPGRVPDHLPPSTNHFSNSLRLFFRFPLWPCKIIPRTDLYLYLKLKKKAWWSIHDYLWDLRSPKYIFGERTKPCVWKAFFLFQTSTLHLINMLPLSIFSTFSATLLTLQRGGI